jgi:hypothetical protein
LVSNALKANHTTSAATLRQTGPPSRRPIGSSTGRNLALVKKPVSIVWEEDTKVTVKPVADDAAGGLTAH